MAKYADIAALQNRVRGLSEWLNENAPECFSEQKHVREGTQERVYWHYGYMVALRDVLRYLTESGETSHDDRKPDTPDSRTAA